MASLGLKKEAADVATNEGSNLLAKWKLALAVGVPVVAVLGVGWYLLRSEKKALVSAEKGSKRVGIAKVYPQQSESANSSPTKPPESKSDAAEAMGRRGNALYREGKYLEALKEYDAAVELCPANPKRELAILYRNRAACHEQLKNYQAVVEECTKALNLDPKYIKALVMRSKAWEQLNNLEEALVDITCSCILDGFQTQSSMATADRILKEVGLRKAKEHLSARKPVLPSNFFIQNYFSSFCEDPIRAEGDELPEKHEEEGCNGETSGNHYIRALRALKCNNYEEVLKECDLELQSYDGKRVAAEGDAGTEEGGDECTPKALLLRGTMYLLMGDGPSTLRDLSACVDHQKATDKVRVNALVKRACQYLQDEKVDQCFPDFKKALKLGPSIADVYHHRGQVYMLLEKYDEAVSDFEKASALKPKFPPPQIQKCLAEYRRAFKEQDFNMIMESSEKFRMTVDKFPECADGFSIYAQILVDLQQFPQAEEYMDRAHKVTPQNAMILVHKGMLKIQARGDVNDAVSWIQKAIDVDEKCEYAYETLATIEVQRGNLEKAVQLFDKAIKLGKTELELTHLFSLREAAASQIRIKDTLGVSVTGALQMAATGAGL